MRQRLLQQIKKVGLAAGDSLMVAVSGGVDSVVLLHQLYALRDELGLHLQVAHLDHQIRPEGSADAEFVRLLCARLNVPCHIEVRDVPAFAKEQKISIEMAARMARHEFLLRCADRVGAALIALAHHRDDQVETFFLRLLRGSGTAGLAAMQDVRDRWWRPLLDCSRQQILTFASSQGLQWVEDASNADFTYLRNRLRHQVLPQLRELNPQLDDRCGELCRQLQADNDYWQQQIAAILPGLITASEDGLRLRREDVLVLPRAVRMRVLRAALQCLRGDLQRLEAVHLNAIDEMLSAERSQAHLDLPGCWAARRYQDLWLRNRAPDVVADYQLELISPGELLLPCGRLLRSSLGDEQLGESPTVVEFCASELVFPLIVRNWRHGDCFAPEGMSGHKRLKRFFGDQKVEMEERSRTPLLVSDATILCLLGQRRSRYAKADLSAGKILRLELI